MPRIRRAIPLAVAVALTAVASLTATPDTASAAAKAPSGLRTTSVRADSVTLAWSAVSKVGEYRIKYSTSSKFTKPKYETSKQVSATVDGLSAKTRYYVKIRTLTASGKGLSGYSKAIAVTTAAVPKPTSATAPLRVASYNIRCANCFDGGKDEGTWPQRREAVVAAILAQKLDVLGVQEASQGRLPDTSENISQFEDLAERLGKPWKLTNTKRYNCVKDSSPNDCTYKAQGASKGTRILYNSDRVDLLAAGSAVLPKPGNDTERSVAWARFRQESTGKSFMFSDLHTTSEDKYYDYKKKQAELAVKTIKANNPSNLPMIAVGDWNSSRFEKPTNAPYDAYVKGGFVDPLGGKYKTSKTAPGATVEKRIQTWVSSSNKYIRQANAHKDWINGSYIDYLMTTPMRVSEWETVAHLDSSGKFIGRIPSDHNMIRATVWLPA